MHAEAAALLYAPAAQGVGLAEEGGQKEPAGQVAEQGAERPVALSNVPAGHGRQLTAPQASL